jgi:hypothetical protein
VRWRHSFVNASEVPCGDVGTDPGFLVTAPFAATRCSHEQSRKPARQAIPRRFVPPLIEALTEFAFGAAFDARNRKDFGAVHRHRPLSDGRWQASTGKG